jgi:hypothetical protein
VLPKELDATGASWMLLARAGCYWRTYLMSFPRSYLCCDPSLSLDLQPNLRNRWNGVERGVESPVSVLVRPSLDAEKASRSEWYVAKQKPLKAAVFQTK